jgi:hypothetical protein
MPWPIAPYTVAAVFTQAASIAVAFMLASIAEALIAEHTCVAV